jgi:hypothetical protein
MHPAKNGGITLIITAVARKLVTIANALCKSRQKGIATAP